MKVRPKLKCEVCENDDFTILQYHHIIPRCDPRCSNDNLNIAILCPNCHVKVHQGEIIIIGVYMTSPDGHHSVWFNRGEDPPFPKEWWIIKDNPLVQTIKGDSDDLHEEFIQQRKEAKERIINTMKRK